MKKAKRFLGKSLSMNCGRVLDLQNVRTLTNPYPKIRQVGPLRDYQREFERLGNKVKGWTQKALVGTFMGGLKTEISDGIRMFKPKTLKEAINYARMRDEQLQRQKKAVRTFNPINPLSPTKDKAATPVKRLSWEEMQKR